MTFKRMAKTCIAVCGQGSGVNALLKYHRASSRRPLIVSYHRIVENFLHSSRNAIPSILTSARTFETHLDWIGRHYDFATLDEISDWMLGKRGGSKPLAAVTFDDGYADVYENAYPILERKGIPSAIFVVSGLVGTSNLHIHDEVFLLVSQLLAEPGPATFGDLLNRHLPDPLIGKMNLPEPYYITRMLLGHLSQVELNRLLVSMRAIADVQDSDLRGLLALEWDMLAEMASSDVTVASHTCTHAFLTNEAPHKVIDEVSRSRRELSQRLHVPVDYFAYPDGRFNSRIIDAVHEAGYRSAFTICGHRDARYPHLTIPRHVLWERTGCDHRNVFSTSVMAGMMHGVLQYSNCSGEHG